MQNWGAAIDRLEAACRVYGGAVGWRRIELPVSEEVVEDVSTGRLELRLVRKEFGILCRGID
jgi:hypothetical protein